MRRSFRTTVLALCAASVLALLEVFRTTVTRLMEGNRIDLHELHRTVFPLWFSVILVSPWCAFMARKFPLRAGRAGRILPAHVGGAFVFVALQVSLFITYHALMNSGGVGSLWPGLVHLYIFYTAMEMSVYAAIVMVLLLVDAHREAADRAVLDAERARTLASARLESLQARIRPHFLFNALNAIAVLARRGDAPAVDHAIGDLGELLRTSFDNDGRHEIPLHEEIAFVERYVALQRIRFPDRLEVAWNVDDEAREGLVPALLVQPIVENAIEHGLSRVAGGRIAVAARRDGASLAIEVSDDGPGFGAGGDPDGGTGLTNTRERLALLYGKAGQISCSDRAGGGGLVRVRLPWHTARGGRT